ncbi:uncharacterized protein LOC100090537 [Ornithorhynchus anatinus]|uniref:uncharacterized protein LOC100090537 n=1 Tax=Ornithorhynchus anatinus TaxID=9258 RepID=UPI0004547B26|nr:uncharacterized protein LOC100090537 [Ornithorhynchus anatinus]
MTSTCLTVLLMATLPLVPAGAGSNSRPCSFPFTYKDKIHTSCTSEDTPGQSWCATAPKFQGDATWKYCTNTEYGGNSKGRPCVFPFAYLERMRYGCVLEDNKPREAWCATTENYDRDQLWSFCPDTMLGGNSEKACEFPFKYKLRLYTACTTDQEASGRAWCATTANFDQDKLWRYCGTLGEEARNAPCVFPFTYRSQDHTACTGAGSEGGRLWCATTHNYDLDKRWHYCSTSAFGGSSQGQPCLFPFLYKGRVQVTCPRDDEGVYWCATTSDYDRDQLWSYCPDTMLGGNSEKACVFPFTYKLRLYTACTTDHEASGRAWCATTANFDQDKLWRYCGTHGKEPGNAPCVFPFTYQNKDYTECTEAGEGKGKLWCATSHNYDKDKKKRYCFSSAYGGSSRGQPCVFPFSFKGHVHITCPQDENKVYWCATTSDYDRDRLWSYCPDTTPRGNNPTDLCVFPFLFGGKNYTSCNRDREGKLWCATTFNFDKDQKRKDCSVRAHGGNSGGQPCVIPFQYRGKTYHGCTDRNSPEGYWCSTTDNYGRDGLWSYCADTAMGGTDPGVPCVFPFAFEDQSYHNCTVTGEDSGRSWCATTDNYPRDRRWTYCHFSGSL